LSHKPTVSESEALYHWYIYLGGVGYKEGFSFNSRFKQADVVAVSAFAESLFHTAGATTEKESEANDIEVDA